MRSTARISFLGQAARRDIGAPLETLRRWEAATDCAICEGYGQTEAGPVISFNPRNGVRKSGGRTSAAVDRGGDRGRRNWKSKDAGW